MKVRLTSEQRRPASEGWLPALSWLHQYDRSTLASDLFAAHIVTDEFLVIGWSTP
jgi:hypothetical protein